ncbi:unnamed protein product [Adineta ricciae]|uniref:Polyhomeotic-like protein 3 n=1 Tax=Adineta ricciae TaxID=249248 RepID=A0A813Z4M7_ADIRI|nr:unnamed protein product [Adineta ricciae]CAF1575267.1 unnamed protein product [Adineta ricciae]
METLAPTAPIKQVKRVCITVSLNSNVNQISIFKGSRASQNNEQACRSPAKPATLLPRPSIGKPSTILPQPAQKSVVLSNSMTPLVPKPIATNGQLVKPSTGTPSAGFTTYLVVDGNQGQLVQVANDGSKPVTFRNQAGQVLQATPITVVSSANQPSLSTTTDSSMSSNSTPVNALQSQLTSATSHIQSNPAQTVTHIQTNASHPIQHIILPNDTTAHQLTGNTHLSATSSLLNDCNSTAHQPSLLQPNPIIPTSILNGSTSSAYERDVSPGPNDNDSSIDDPSTLDGSTTQDPNVSLSLSQIVRKTNHRHRRSSNSSKKKRGRPRLYERDPFTNKPIKSRSTLEATEVALPNVTMAPATTLLIPGQTPILSTMHPYPNGCTSLIFPSQPLSHTTTIPVNNPSLLQQQSYSYPSLLNGGSASSTNMLTVPTLNILSSDTVSTPAAASSYSYAPSSSSTILPPPLLSSSTLTTTTMTTSAPPPPFVPPVSQTVENQVTIPLKNLQISSTPAPTTSSPRSSTVPPPTTVPNVVPLNPSPIKPFHQTQNNDVVVHYIGGFVIRESSHPFPSEDPNDISKDSTHSNGREKENNSFNDNNSDLGSDQLRCISCKKVDFSERFYSQEKKFCSKACSTKPLKGTKVSNGKKSQQDTPPVMAETFQHIEKVHVDQPKASLPPDHGLPMDPSKWTVSQVGEFIGRLTNDNIREVFCESEMDGQALLLMTQEHLRDTMKIKLGPSLIISSEITKLRERARAFS